MSYSSQTASSILLKELGEDLGLPLRFDEHNQCLLILDDRLMISIHTVEDSWVLYGMLGECYQNQDRGFFQYLFSLNQILAEQGHGALAFDKHNSAILYIQHIPLRNADRVSLFQALEVFTDWLEILIKRLTESGIEIERLSNTDVQSESPSSRKAS
jgi:hypothetical protein